MYSKLIRYCKQWVIVTISPPDPTLVARSIFHCNDNVGGFAVLPQSLEEVGPRIASHLTEIVIGMRMRAR